MKTIKRIMKFYIILLFIFTVRSLKAQNVVISDDSTYSGNNNALLEVHSFSGSKGVLLPSMSTAQRNAMSLAGIDEGLIVYDIDTKNYWYWNGTQWSAITDQQTLIFQNDTLYISDGNQVDLSSLGNDWKKTGNTGTNSTNNFVGTTDSVGLSFRTNNTERMIITARGNIGVGTTIPVACSAVDIDFSNKGLLIPRINLLSDTDTTTIHAPIKSLVIYNTNASMGNGNSEGFYYWAGNKWIAIPAPENGPGAAGQVLTSQGVGVRPQWKSLQTSGGGPTGCANCITETRYDAATHNFTGCRDYCRSLGAGWRIPTYEEEMYIMSGNTVIMDNGYAPDDVWTTSTITNPINGGGTCNYISYYYVIDESSGNIHYTTSGSGTNRYCRCVK